MLSYVKGTLVESTPTHAIVDVHGLGYYLTIPLSTFTKLPTIDKEVFLYVSEVIREDSHKLFGFIERDEKELFEKIRSVSGIGPKTAISIIGHMAGPDLQAAIANANVALLSKIPGIGKKTAERLIVEMRDSMKGRKQAVPIKSNLVTEEDRLVSDALSALMNLGYNAMQAQKAIQKALDATDVKPELSTLISTALKSS